MNFINNILVNFALFLNCGTNLGWDLIPQQVLSVQNIFVYHDHNAVLQIP